MKTTNILYWIFTGLLAVGFIFSSIPDVMVTSQAVAIFKHLNYPEYLIRFSGIAKLCAVAVILYPGVFRLKEWAYAGLTFDLTGAIYGGLSVGDPFIQWVPVIVIGLVLIGGSYFFYHKKRKLTLAKIE